jgi:hypothetical protein
LLVAAGELQLKEEQTDTSTCVCEENSYHLVKLNDLVSICEWSKVNARPSVVVILVVFVYCGMIMVRWL